MAELNHSKVKVSDRYFSFLEEGLIARYTRRDFW